MRSTALEIDVAGRDCLDVGASTGGFTDCLLQRGAARVAALDVAYGQIDLRLREDPRVTVIERLNARELGPADLPFRARTWPRSTSPSSRWPRSCRPSPAAWRRAASCWRWSSPSSSSAASGSRKGVVRDAADRREAILAVAAARRGARPAGPRLRLLRPAGAEGQPGDLRLVRRRRARRPRSATSGERRSHAGARRDRCSDRAR